MNYLEKLAAQMAADLKENGYKGIGTYNDPFKAAKDDCPADYFDDAKRPEWCPMRQKEYTVMNAIHCVPCWLREVEENAG